METGPIETPKPMRIRVPTPIPTTLPPTTTTTKKPTTTTPEPEYPDPDFGPLAPAPPSGPKLPGGVDFGSLAKTFMGGGSGGGIVGQFLGSGLGGGNSGPPPTSSVVPDGYGGASLGGAGIGGGNPGGNGGGNGNFISLIANTVKELNNKPPGGQPGASAAAQVAQQWLNPQQIGQFGSLFSSFGR
uniref:Uncharacterized protein n=1 Tax=Panagrolaimus sp. JU765 TaxID=591449 RepID=A0AC34RDH4_9BILA